MANDFYNAGGAPSPHSTGTSSTIRSEFAAIATGFDKFPALSGNATKLLRVNASGNAIESTDATTAGLLTTAAAASTYLPLVGGTLTGKLTASTGGSAEAIRIVGTGSYLSIYNTANSTRYAYLAADVTNVDLAAENGSMLRLITNSAERLRIATNGDVSIGGVTPLAKLDIAGGGNTYLAVRTDTGSIAGIQIAGNGTGLGSSSFDLQQDGTGAVDIVQRAPSRMSFYTNNTERVRIDVSGNVAVSTAGARLLLGAGSSGTGQLYVFKTGAVDVPIEASSSVVSSAFGTNSSGSTNAWGAPSATTYVANQGAYPLVFTTSGAERVRIDTSGNMIVGGTSPAARFHVVTATAGQSVGYFANGGAASTFSAGTFTNNTDADCVIQLSGVGAGTKFASIGPSVSIPLIFNVSLTEKMRLDTSGRLGIGMTPLGDTAGYGGITLETAGPIYARQNTDTSKYLSLGTSGGVSWIEANGTSQQLIFVVAAVERMRINNAGQLGLGVTPAAAFHMTGEMRMQANGSYISGYNDAGSTRNGFLQFNNTGNVDLAGEGGSALLRFFTNGSARLTINASGTLTAADASGLAALNASSLASGTVPAGRISGATAYDISAATVNSNLVGYRNVPRATSYSGTTADVGKCFALSAAPTIPASVYSAGDAFSIYNDSAAAINITQGTSLTLRLGASTGTGTRVLAARGMCTIWFNSSTEAIAFGSGLT